MESGSFTLRIAAAEDAEAVTAIINDGASELADVEAVRGRLISAAAGDTAPTAGSHVRRLVAVDTAGRVVGYGHALREDWMEPGLFWAHVAVAPDARRQGAGGALFAAVRAWAVERGATSMLGEGRDNLDASKVFARYLGFQSERHIFESTLDLATFDEAPTAPRLEAARAAGIRFLTMAEAGDTDAARRALWALERTVGRDIPGSSEAAIIPYETWRERVCDAPGYDPALQIIAAAGPEEGAAWVGLARLEVWPGMEGMYNGVTGVLPAWRGRGLAQALKLLAIRAAIQRGAPYLRTNNDSLNAPMLAVNRTLGYQPQPGYERMRLWLTGSR